DALDQILHYMGRSCKQEHEILSPPPARPSAAGSSRYLPPIDTVLAGHGFMKLPPLESPSSALTTTPPHVPGEAASSAGAGADELHRRGGNGITDWA
ncbi:hypothetical protein OV602_24785, partial [Salmonella enterica subsp. enterica serovar 1,4,[5],12:i:-]|nr:hypothetical protein [Salmonella enterica subsp. enterica serovar 1,4,[5],12:i:-]